MKILDTTIADVKVISPHIFGDERGFFFESWNRQSFSECGIDVDFVQDNHSKSAKGVLRGLHYQIQRPQGKLVRVVSGRVFDVAVDLRRSSPTFGQWAGAELSADNKCMMWIPPGFAHGFLTLEEGTEFLYKCTDLYAPEHERSLLWSDAEIDIDWPLSDVREPLLSDKDRNARAFAASETYA